MDNAAARQGNLEMVKYCVANECLLISGRVQMYPKRSSRGTQILAKKPKRLGVLGLLVTRNGHLHIPNILLSVV